jgi:autotransporter-associated beta strand protein
VFAGAAVVTGLSRPAHATVTIDGSLDADYGAALATQTNNTGFGLNTDTDGLNANGSQLDAAYGIVQGGNLDLFFAGNLETNLNHLDIFIADGRTGQSTLDAGNNNQGGLYAMNGSKFSPGFSGTYALDINGSGTEGSSPTWYVDSYDLTQAVAPPKYEGYFVPTADGIAYNPFNGSITSSLTFSFNNSNTTGGVNGTQDSAASATAADSVTTGFEMAIPLSTLGSPHGGSIEVLADINGGGNSYLSNQFLPGIPVGNDLGTATFNFSATAGQYFTVSVPTNPNQINGTWIATGMGGWEIAGNWSGGIPTNASDTATFGSSITAPASVKLDGSKTVGEITFNSPISYSIDPGTGGTLTINDAGDTPVNPFISVEAGNHAITAPVSLANGVTITTADSTSLSISGAISGVGPLTKAGAGTLFLSTANTYSGTTAVTNGELLVQNTAAAPGEIDLGAPTDGVLATLGVTSGFTITNSIVTIEDGSGSDNDRVITPVGAAGSTTFSGPLTLNGGAILAAGVGNTIVYNGLISDGASTDSVAKHDLLINSVGASLGGTVYLTNTNTYSGITAIDAGTLLVNNSASAGNGAGTIYIGNGTPSSTYGDVNAALLVNTAGVTITNTLQTNQADDGTSIGIGTRTIGATNASGVVTYSGGVTVNGGAVLAAAAGGTVSFSGIISGNGGGGNYSNSVTISGPGTVVLSAANTYAGNTTVNAGALIITAGGSLPTTTNLTVGDGTDIAQVSLPAASPGAGILSITLGSIIMEQNGLLSVTAPDVHSDRSVITTGNLTFFGTTGNWDGLLDLNTNDLVFTDGSTSGLTSVTNQIKEGFNGGNWTGAGGITSSTLKAAVAAHPGTVNTTLGVELNDNGAGTALISTFDGQPTVDGDVLVKYTYFGDANLDGVVNASDYTAIDNGYNEDQAYLVQNPGGTALPATGWANGDFNYDGVINGDDYILIDNAYNTQGASLAIAGAMPLASATAQIAAVPEPGSVSLIAIGAFGLLKRRRRRI